MNICYNEKIMKGGITVKKGRLANVGRDYSKPMILDLRGVDGFRKYVKLVTSPRTDYNAKEEAKKAADNLRKQGLTL